MLIHMLAICTENVRKADFLVKYTMKEEEQTNKHPDLRPNAKRTQRINPYSVSRIF